MTCLLCTSASAQTYSLSNASASGVPAGAIQVEIAVAKPGPAGAAALPPPEVVRDVSRWRVTVFRKGEPQKPMAQTLSLTTIVPSANYSVLGIVTLQTGASGSLDPSVDRSILSVQIDFLFGDSVAQTVLTGGASPPAGGASQMGMKGGCGSGTHSGLVGETYLNFCLSGIWIPQVGSHPLYSTNSNFAVARNWLGGSIGAAGQESADSSIVLDPNAFNAGFFYQRFLATHGPAAIHLFGAILNWRFVGTEFDRKKKNTNLGTNVNLVTAPQVALPFDLGHGVGFEIDLGIEAGKNYKNNINPNGFGEVFRGVPGAQIARIIQKPAKNLAAINLSAQYQVRIPAESEVLTRSIHGKLFPFQGTQARHYATAEVDFMFTKNFGLTMKYDYGALPPGFVWIRSRATVGLTVQSAPKS